MYLTFAEDLMLFQIAKYTIIHAHSKQATKSHRKLPGSSIPELICKTLCLEVTTMMQI